MLTKQFNVIWRHYFNVRWFNKIIFSHAVFRFPLILRGLACIRGAVDKAFPSMAAGVAVVAAVLHAELAIRHKMDEKPCPGIPRANVHHTLRDSEWIHQLLGYARHYIGHGKMLRLLAIDQRRFDNCPRFSKMMAVHTEDLTELYQVSCFISTLKSFGFDYTRSWEQNTQVSDESSGLLPTAHASVW